MDFNEIMARITVLAKARGHTDRSLSMAAGMSADGIRNWRRRMERGEKLSVSLANMLAVAKVLDVPIEFLTDGRRHPSDMSEYVEVTGKVGDHGTVFKHPKVDPGTVKRIVKPTDITIDEMQAIEVVGTHLAPVFLHGDIIIFENHDLGRVPEFAMDRICLCEDAGGNGWIKVLRLGTKPDHYHLISVNTLGQNIWDVPIVWAAPIISHQSAEFVKWYE